MLCGTEPHPRDFKAKKYKIDKHTLSKTEFVFMMRNLPVHVEDSEIEEMFQFADTDQDGQLSFSEFSTMVNPPAVPEWRKPHIRVWFGRMLLVVLSQELGREPQEFSPIQGAQQPLNMASPLLPSSSSKVGHLGNLDMDHDVPVTGAPGTTRSRGKPRLRTTTNTNKKKTIIS